MAQLDPKSGPFAGGSRVESRTGHLGPDRLLIQPELLSSPKPVWDTHSLLMQDLDTATNWEKRGLWTGDGSSRAAPKVLSQPSCVAASLRISTQSLGRQQPMQGVSLYSQGPLWPVNRTFP